MTDKPMGVEQLIADAGLRCELISSTNVPNRTMFAALHQDYSANYVGDAMLTLDESQYGDIMVKRVLANNRGHYGIAEHVSVTVSFGFYPHNSVAQATRHRLASFDVQSFRYTGDHIVKLYEDSGRRLYDEALERLIYLRPVGGYRSRNGGVYQYTEERRARDLDFARYALVRYIDAVGEGMPLEQARGMLPYDYRQHLVVTMNLRAAMHFLDIRGLTDAQIEIRAMAYQLHDVLYKEYPEVMEWYTQNRFTKNKLAP